MALTTARTDKPGGRRPSAPAPWPRVLATWVFAALMPLMLAAGFNVGVDAQGYFGLNSHGSYGGDEFLIKSSMVRHVEHDALLLGDSRAAFIDASAVEGYRFFNAGVGGGRLEEYLALLEASDRSNLRLVVLLEGVGLRSCEGGENERYGLDPLLRHALSFEALRASAAHLFYRWSGYLPDHRADGTRFPDNRLHIPFDWNGARAERYLAKLDDYEEGGPLEDSVGLSPSCRKILLRMREIAAEAGAEFLLVLHPVNHDIVARTRTDVPALRARVRDRILNELPFARDYTVSEYGRGRHFSPYDPVHFLPDSGARMLTSATRRRG